MLHRHLLTLALLMPLGACTLAQAPAPDVVPTLPPGAAMELAALHDEMVLVRQDLQTLERRLEVVEPLTPRVVQLEAIQASLRKMPKLPSKRGRTPGEPTPEQLVRIANQEARISPTAQGFWGRSSSQVYVWQPGRIFDVFLTNRHATIISFPPGEEVSAGLTLDKDLFDVLTTRTGTEPFLTDSIRIHARDDQGEVDAIVQTRAGRLYAFHFKIGQVGMLSVSFQLAPVTVEPKPPLILPRPPS